MFRKLTPGVLAVVAALLLTQVVRAAAPQSPAARQVPSAAEREKVKAAVAKVGSGLKARVKVTLRDGTKLRGFISRIGEDDFELVSTDEGSIGRAHAIKYEDVLKLKGRGVSIDWLRVASTTVKGAGIFLQILRGVNLRLPPHP